MAFAFKLEKSRIISATIRPVGVAFFFSGLFGLLTSNHISLESSGDFDQVDTSGLELRNCGPSPHQLTSWRKLWLVLWCGGRKGYLQIPVNIIVTNLPMWISCDLKTCIFDHLQLPDVDMGCRPPGRTHVVHHVRTELPINQTTFRIKVNPVFELPSFLPYLFQSTWSAVYLV